MLILLPCKFDFDFDFKLKRAVFFCSAVSCSSREPNVLSDLNDLSDLSGLRDLGILRDLK